MTSTLTIVEESTPESSRRVRKIQRLMEIVNGYGVKIDSSMFFSMVFMDETALEKMAKKLGVDISML